MIILAAPEPLSASLTVGLTPSEKERVRAAAGAVGMSAWARDAINARLATV